MEGAAIADTLSSYILKNGRMQTFTLGQHHGILLTSKHENSIAYDTNLRYIAPPTRLTVLIIVDAVSGSISPARQAGCGTSTLTS